MNTSKIFPLNHPETSSSHLHALAARSNWDVKQVLKRLVYINQCLEEDESIPNGWATLLSDKCNELVEYARNDCLSLELLKDAMDSMAFICYSLHDPLSLSDAVVQIRTLDLELNDQHIPSPCFMEVA